MEPPRTQAIKQVGRGGEGTTHVTKAALESNDNVDVLETAGHQVKTRLRVTGS